ncbi:MAG: alpha/beta hydrolase [Myxococcaceae bacterium]
MLKNQLKVRDLKIAYVHLGADKDPAQTRLFIHGWGLRMEAFDKLLETLSADYPVLALDLPGFGDSTEPYFWGYEAYAQFISEFLDALGISQIHIMGQSMGGGIALTTAALFPERVRSVVIMNSAGIPMRDGQPSIINRIQELWAQGFDRHILDSFLFNGLRHIKSLARSVSVPVKHDIRSLLPRIQAPVLLAWGDCDKMLPIQFAYEMAALIPKAKVAPISGGFHEWGLIQPEIFCSLAKQFDASLPSKL